MDNLYCHLQFRDKKTGCIRDWRTDCLEAEWNLGWKFNDFIIVDNYIY